jgi:hypothetical protein
MALGIPIGLIWDNVPSPAVQPCNDPNNIEDLIAWYDFTDGNTVFQNYCGTSQAVDGGVIARIQNKSQSSDRIGMFMISGGSWGDKDADGTFKASDGTLCQTPPVTSPGGSVNARPILKVDPANGLTYGLFSDGRKLFTSSYMNGNDASFGDRAGGYGNGVDMNTSTNTGFLSNGSSNPNGNVTSNATITTDDFSCFWVTRDANEDPSNTHFHFSLRKYGDPAGMGEVGYIYHQHTGISAITAGGSDSYQARINSEATSESDSMTLGTDSVDTNINRFSLISGSGTDGVSFSKNGGTADTDTISSSSSFSMAKGFLSIGSQTVGNTGSGVSEKVFEGYFYEFMFFNRKLNAEEVECIENYLQNKYT